jgi:hypothetical protein
VFEETIFTIWLPPQDRCEQLRSIPLDKDAERLGPYETPPPQDEWDAYTRVAKPHKLCNYFHLNGSCGLDDCLFTHRKLDFIPANVLRYNTRQQKCNKSGRCRDLDYFYGHHF